jgi:hypothetical protein
VGLYSGGSGERELRSTAIKWNKSRRAFHVVYYRQPVSRKIWITVKYKVTDLPGN